MQHHQATPVLVYDIDMQFRFHVHLAHRLEVFLQVSEDIRQSLFVPVSRRYLLVLELGTVRRQLLHLDQSRRERSLLHKSHFLADPHVQRARELAILRGSSLRLGVVQRVNCRRLREHVVERRDVRYQGLLVRLRSVNICAQVFA